jgi:SAM-dependent methyltransferase
MRVLDLGCGSGGDPVRRGITDSDHVTGVDINEEQLGIARQRFPKRAYFLGAGENLPFGNASFDRVISNVALPYMDIPKTLSELHRVLAPGGRVRLTLHTASFTIRELRKSFPGVIPCAFRLYVLGNGLWFHCTGKTIRFAGRTESFQTQRGMRIALSRAGFTNLNFSEPEGPFGKRLVVEAGKVEHHIQSDGQVPHPSQLLGRVS